MNSLKHFAEATALSAAVLTAPTAEAANYKKVNPANAVQLQEATGNGVVSSTISQRGRRIDAVMNPNGAGKFPLQCPVDGTWEPKILNKGGFKEGKDATTAGKVELEKMGDDGVSTIVVVAPNQPNVSRHIEAACVQKVKDETRSTQRVNIMIETGAAHGNSTASKSANGAFGNCSDCDDSFLEEGDRVGFGPMLVLENEEKDGVLPSLGGQVWGQHAISDMTHLGLRFGVSAIPDDVKVADKYKTVYVPQLGGFAEIGLHTDGYKVDANLGAGYVYSPSKVVSRTEKQVVSLDSVGGGSGEVPNGTVAELNAGYTLGEDFLRARLGAMMYTDFKEDSKTAFFITLDGVLDPTGDNE